VRDNFEKQEKTEHNHFCTFFQLKFVASCNKMKLLKFIFEIFIKEEQHYV